MKFNRIIEYFKVFLLFIVMLIFVQFLRDYAFLPYLQIAIDGVFYIALVNMLYVIIYYNFIQKERTFPTTSLMVLIWFTFLKFVDVYGLFIRDGKVYNSEFLIVLTVMTLLFIAYYIYKTIIKTFKLKEKIRINPYTLIALSFAGLIFIGTILLFLPVSRNPEMSPISLTDALFTATSSVCVTGLVVVDTGSYFSIFGQVLILILLQIGGLGIMTFSGFFTLIIGEKMSLFERYTARDAVSGFSASETGKFLVSIVLTTFIIEIIGAGLLLISFSKKMPFGQALYTSIFHSVSAFCNAGFSLFSNSLIAYKSNGLVNFTIMILIMLGGIGFSVLVNLFRKIKKKDTRFTLHTKLVLTATVFLILSGAIGFYFLEINNLLANIPLGNGILTSLFSSITTRTAGFNTVDFGQARESTLFFMSIFMFIGASPGSTGGGIKTTTIVILALTIYNTLRGRSHVRMFGREIPIDLIRKSLVLFFLSISWLAILILLIGSIESFTFSRVLFECVSAFGTVGLSTGITTQLSKVSKILITITMFAGRVGPLTLILSLGMNNPKGAVRRPKEKVLIG